MKITLIISSILLLIILFYRFKKPENKTSIYQFKAKTIDGKILDFSTLKGKKILIVNTASECGNTPQYSDLEKLYEKYKNKLVVIGFPANNFGKQEPGNNIEIATFCKKNYDVTFPMMSKVSSSGARKRWITSPA